MRGEGKRASQRSMLPLPSYPPPSLQLRYFFLRRWLLSFFYILVYPVDYPRIWCTATVWELDFNIILDISGLRYGILVTDCCGCESVKCMDCPAVTPKNELCGTEKQDSCYTYQPKAFHQEDTGCYEATCTQNESDAKSEVRFILLILVILLILFLFFILFILFIRFILFIIFQSQKLLTSNTK